MFGRRLTIVMYHRVTDEDVSRLEHSLPYLFTSTRSLDSQLAFYKKHYEILNFEQLSSMASIGKLPRNSLIITFDDGYKDNVVNAFPLIKRFDCPWVLFLVTGYVGSNDVYWWDGFYNFMKYLENCEMSGQLNKYGHDFEVYYSEFKRDPSALFSSLNELPSEKMEKLLKRINSYIMQDKKKIYNENCFMDWYDIREIEPYTEFGAHTHSHVNLSLVGRHQVREEVRLPKKIIEKHIERNISVFSFPAGKYNDSTISEVKNAGYNYAVTTKAGINDLKNPYALKRINICESTVPYPEKSKSKGWLSYKLLGF